jgi:hypothetical protein
MPRPLTYFVPPTQLRELVNEGEILASSKGSSHLFLVLNVIHLNDTSLQRVQPFKRGSGTFTSS